MRGRYSVLLRTEVQRPPGGSTSETEGQVCGRRHCSGAEARCWGCRGLLPAADDALLLVAEHGGAEEWLPKLGGRSPCASAEVSAAAEKLP